MTVLSSLLLSLRLLSSSERYLAALTVVCSPEHGFRGVSQAGEGAGGTFIDNSTGLTVYGECPKYSADVRWL